MYQQSISILLVEDNPDDVALIQEYVAAASRRSYALTTTDRLSEGIRLAKASPFDAILLDLGLPDSQGISTVTRFREHIKETPIVVLSGSDEDDAIERALSLGAQDYLVKGQFAGEVVTRAIRNAIERQTTLLSLESERQKKREMTREHLLMERLGENELPTTAAAFGISRLAESSPEYFDLFVERYIAELDRALERRAHGTSTLDSSDDFNELAQHLGSLRAGPRDALDIHMAAVKRKTTDLDARRAEVYVEEGRFIILRLMGHLVTYYRARPFQFSSLRKPHESDQES